MPNLNHVMNETNTAIATVLAAANAQLDTMTPIDAVDFLQQLQIQLGKYANSVLREVVCPMIKAGRTELLLSSPQSNPSGIILPSKDIIA